MGKAPVVADEERDAQPKSNLKVLKHFGGETGDDRLQKNYEQLQ